jgi:hypothetical protein
LIWFSDMLIVFRPSFEAVIVGQILDLSLTFTLGTAFFK